MRMADNDGCRICRIISDSDFLSDEGSSGLIALSPELDTSSLVDKTELVMEKCFCHGTGIDEVQRPAVPVPFLKRGDPFRRHCRAKTPVVFRDSFMRVLVVILLKIERPPVVELIKRSDRLQLDLPEESVHDLMELFNLAFGFPAPYRGMQDADAEPGK